LPIFGVLRFLTMVAGFFANLMERLDKSMQQFLGLARKESLWISSEMS